MKEHLSKYWLIYLALVVLIGYIIYNNMAKKGPATPGAALRPNCPPPGRLKYDGLNNRYDCV